MNGISEFNEIYTAVSAIYTMGKPIVSFIKNKHKEEQMERVIEDALNSKIEEILRNKLAAVLLSQKEQIESENYEQILDYNFKETVMDEVMSQNAGFRIYKKEIEEYVQEFMDTVLKYLESKAKDSFMLKTVIQLNRHTEIHADIRKEEIKRVIYTALNEQEKKYVSEVGELPFEIENMRYCTKINNGKIEHNIIFKLSKQNYKVILDEAFVAVESATGLWAFHNQKFFMLNGRLNSQNVLFIADSCGIKKIESAGIVVYFTVYNYKKYYVRMFGNMEMLYYEPLTEQEYNEGREQYRIKYKDATKNDSVYEEWRKYYASVMYTDFGHRK